jgi:prolycopene isomerase
MQDAHLKDPKLKAIVSVLWGYYGLPPSQLASIYFALPTIGYLQQGGFYPRGKSQAISNAFARFIEKRGGKVLLKSRVERILVKDGAAVGVATADGREHLGKAVISNANVYDTFHTLLQDDGTLKDYHARLDTMKVSLSSFQVFLGLKRDLVKELGLKDSEIEFDTGYDPEAAFRSCVAGAIEDGGFGLTLYDNVYPGYSPPGKNTVTLITLQGYDYWKKYEADYFKGKKDAYRAEKERLADVLIDQAEKRLMPGLRKAIAVREVATPLTNVRYTSNYRGGIYGWDQTLDNAMPNRLPQATPLKNLYLASAWTQPGGGYGGVIWSGIQCFGEVMRRRG